MRFVILLFILTIVYYNTEGLQPHAVNNESKASGKYNNINS